MKKLLKILWILVVYLLHISSCDVKSDFLKHFKYLESVKFDDIFPRIHTLTSNSGIIGLKCPRMNITIPNVNLKNYIDEQVNITIGERNLKIINQSDNIMIYGYKERNAIEWNIYDIREIVGKKKIICHTVDIKSNKYGTRYLLWYHQITNLTKNQKNIVKQGYLNVINHTLGQNIYDNGFEERTIVFREKSSKRNFDFKNPYLYKGDTLVTFKDSNFYSYDIEFQEPIGIAKINHPPPSFEIGNDPGININLKNKEWWFVEPQSFPWTFTFNLVYYDITKQPHFFDYENINVSYLRYSKDNKLEIIKKDILKPNSPNTGNISFNESSIIKLNYFCDNCIEGGIDVIQNMIIGKKFDFKNKTLASVKYVYNKLDFEANCSMNLNALAPLKTVSFNYKKVEVQALHEMSNKSKENFELNNDVVIFKSKNPSGTLNCIYIYPMGELITSQVYTSSYDKELPLFTYYRDKLLTKPNCSTIHDENDFLKTFLFDNERFEIDDLENIGNGTKGNFKYNETLVTFTGTNPNGRLSCIYKIFNGEYSINQIYESFEDQDISPVTYSRDELRLTPNCSMDKGDSVKLKAVSFNGESVDVNDFNSTSDKSKGSFKSDGKFVNFTETNPKGKLTCIFKLTYGEFSTNQLFGNFSNTDHPIIRYAFDQLEIRPNCPVEPEKNVNLKTILFNDESVEAEYFQNTISKLKGNFKLEEGSVYFTGANPEGKCTCVYKLQFGGFKTSQEYQSIEGTTLPDVKYAEDQLDFHLNCSREENVYTQLKAIVLSNKRIEVEGLGDGALSQIGNIMLRKNLLLYTVQNPKGKFSCVYKVPIGEIEKSQNYVPISNETHPVVEYPFNELGYNSNCSRHLNSFTHLRGITFKDDSTTIADLERSRFGALGRLQLDEDFVINTEKNPNGTLFCLYDVPIGEVMITKSFLIFKTGGEENSSNKMRYIASMILGYMIVISMII